MSNYNVVAQQYGFSRPYIHEDDTLPRNDHLFFNLLYAPVNQSIIAPFSSRTQNFIYLTHWRRLDLNGNTLAQRVEDKENADLYQNQHTSFAFQDSNFVLSAGSYRKNQDTFNTLFVQKFDAITLAPTWIQEHQLTFNHIYISGIIPINETEIIITPVLERSANVPPYAQAVPFASILKMDTAGNLLWHRHIDSTIWNNVNHATKAHDGNIMLCGVTKGYGTPDNGAAWVMKVDTAGNKLWHRTYNLPGYDGLLKMTATSDGNYVCVGGGASTPVISDMPNGVGRILKIDEDGNVIWDKRTDISPRAEELHTVVEASNGDIVAFGGTYKYYAYDQYNYQVGSTREADGWAVRLDANGNEVWNRVFGHNAAPHAHEYIYNAIALPDGGFVAGATTQVADSYWYQGNRTPYKRQAAWLVKLDANGCVDTACSEILGTGMGSKASPQRELSLYPNPGNGEALLKAEQPLPANTQISINDIMGRTIWQTTIIPGTQQITIDISRQPNGVYLVRLQAGAEVYSFKYVLTQE